MNPVRQLRFSNAHDLRTTEAMEPLSGCRPSMAGSFFPLTHHFVVGFASLCHGSSHDLPLSAAPPHPSTRGAYRGPRLRRFRAWQKHTSQSSGIHTHLNNIRFCQRATLHGTEPCIFLVY